jgi:hypothetical protein
MAVVCIDVEQSAEVTVVLAQIKVIHHHSSSMYNEDSEEHRKVVSNTK